MLAEQHHCKKKQIIKIHGIADRQPADILCIDFSDLLPVQIDGFLCFGTEFRRQNFIPFCS